MTGYFTITNDSALWTNTGHDYAIFSLEHASVPVEFWDNVTSNGGNIRVYYWDGSTETPVAREIHNIDTTGEIGIIYFDATDSQASTANEWRVYVEDGATEPVASSTYGSEAVWSDFIRVSHEAAATDSTGNGNSGTLGVNLTPGDVAGLYSDATSFPNNPAPESGGTLGDPDNMVIGSNPIDLTQDFTVSIMIKASDTESYSQHTGFQLDDGSEWLTLGTSGLITDLKILSNGETPNQGTLMSNGTWYHQKIRYRSSANEFDAILDGQVDYTVSPNGNGWQSSNQSIVNKVRVAWHGQEHNLRQNAVSDAYNVTEYNNQNDVESFWTVSPWTSPRRVFNIS